MTYLRKVHLEKVKKIWVLGLWVAVCFYGLCRFSLPALAAMNFQPVPAARISCEMPIGLVATETKTPGKVDLLIDSENSDWTQALLYSGSLEQVTVRLEVDPPTGAKKYKMSGGTVTDEDLWSILEGQGDWAMMEVSNEWASWPFGYHQNIADYSSSRSILTPWPDLSDYRMFLRWYDDQNNEMVTEKLQIQVDFTSVRSFYVSLPMLPKVDIFPNSTNLSDVSAETSRGEVVYTIIPAGATSTEEWEDISTKVKAPPGAEECMYISMNEGWDILQVENGFVEWGVSYVQNYEYLKRPRQVSFSLIWLDGYQEMIGYSVLSMRVQNKEQMEPWPSYVPGWSAVPNSRLQVSQNIQNSGVDASYDQGELEFIFNGTLPDASSIDLAQIEVSVTPPSGAQAYKIYVSRGSSLGDPSWHMNDMSIYFGNQEAMVLLPGMDAWPMPTELFRECQTEDDLTVYFSNQIGKLENGMVYVYQWYQDHLATMPLSVEYYYVTADEFVHIVETPAVATEVQVPGNVINPIIVGQPNWRFITELYPQVGDNAKHYELHVKDENDSIVILPGNAVVYLPYPPGLNFGSNMAYTLKHYDLEFENYGNVQIVPTEKGLRFETSSLSPFVISWTADAAKPPVSPIPKPPILPTPKTGDFFPTNQLICVIIVLLGIAGMVRFKKRKRSA